MGASEIKAGGAYVEIGAKFGPLEVAFGVLQGKMGAFAAKMSQIGAPVSALGKSVAGSLLEYSDGFATHAQDISKVMARTGFSAEFVQGMEYAAESAGVSASAITSAMRTMGKSLKVEAGESSQDAFLRMAEAVAQIEDPMERAQAATEKFGRAGIELLPVIEQGIAGVKAKIAEDNILGALTDKQVAKGNDLNDSFDRLARAVVFLKNQIGAALAPTLGPVLDSFTDFVVWSNKAIEQNPGLVESIAKIATGFAAVGTALAATGAAMMALMNPIVLAVGALFLVVGSILAVTDSLGKTNTGFGDLWNSIKLGGKGLADWLKSLWNSVIASFDMVVEGFKSAWFGAQELLLRGMKLWLDNFVDTTNTIIGIFNRLKNMGVFGVAAALSPNVGNIDASKISGALSRAADGAGNDKMTAAYKSMNAALTISGELSSGVDMKKGVEFDQQKFLEGMEKIGDGVGGVLKGLWEKIIKELGARTLNFQALKRDQLATR